MKRAVGVVNSHPCLRGNLLIYLSICQLRLDGPLRCCFSRVSQTKRIIYFLFAHTHGTEGVHVCRVCLTPSAPRRGRSPPDGHPIGPPVGPAPQHACRQALDDLRSAKGVAVVAADVVRDHVPHAPQLLGRVRADARLQEDLGLCVRVVRVRAIDAEARRIDGRLCVRGGT